MTKLANNKPTVAAVITTYNRPDYLRSAVKSVQAQTYEITEIIVVDDCSPESIENEIQELVGASLKYERLSQNSGANSARNRGIEIASSEYIAFLDDDDEWLPEKIENQIRELINRDHQQRYVGSLCSYRFLESEKDRSWGATGKVSLQTLKSGNPYCGTSGLIVQRKYLLETKFDEALPCGQDWDIYVRLALQGDLIYLNIPLLLYRRGSHDSLTTKAKKMSILEAEQRLASTYKHEQWLGKKNFRKRISTQILSYIFLKKDKTKWIKKSIQLAGLSATLQVLATKAINGFVNKG